MPSPEAIAFGLSTSQGISLRSITQKVKYSAFTVVSGLATSGSMTLATRLPSGAIPFSCKVKVNTGFTGTGSEATAVMNIGLANIAVPVGYADSATGVIDYDCIALTAIDVFTAGKTYQRMADLTDVLLLSQNSSQLASPTVANENYIMLTITMASGSAAWADVTTGEAVVSVYYFGTTEGAGEAPGVGL